MNVLKCTFSGKTEDVRWLQLEWWWAHIMILRKQSLHLWYAQRLEASSAFCVGMCRYRCIMFTWAHRIIRALNFSFIIGGTSNVKYGRPIVNVTVVAYLCLGRRRPGRDKRWRYFPPFLPPLGPFTMKHHSRCSSFKHHQLITRVRTEPHHCHL